MMNCALALESCDGECEDLMEAVKEGKRAATAANESGWGGRGEGGGGVLSNGRWCR